MLLNYFSVLYGAIALFSFRAAAFNPNCNSNYVSYYGQNSARNQKSLGEYCKDATEDVIILSFMNGFPNILLNFANACETTFEGTALLHCPNMAQDIKYCQSKGKAVILSMGGASGAYGFYGDSDAIAFADTVWNMFFKGNSDTRPFDDAVLDGIDLDIEGGSGAGYPAFIKQLRSHYASDPSKKYYTAAAPQCPFPDVYLSSTLNSAWFDMVYVQFYNNYCGLNSYSRWFNFDEWDNWAKTKALNKDVKVYIGAPGSPSAASSGYADGETLVSIYNNVRSKYSSLGGIMTWDVSQSRTSGIARSIRTALDSGGMCTHSNNTEAYSASTTSTASTKESASSSSTSSKHSTDSYSETSTSHKSTDDTLIVTTETQEVTSVSTFVTTFLTEVTTESTFTSYLTTVYTYTETEDNTESDLETEAPSELPTSSNSTNSKCPVEGMQCREATQGCNKSGYALCSSGKWIVYPCSTGTSCYIIGSMAICDWDNTNRDPCNIQSIQRNPVKQSSGWRSRLDSTLPISAFTSEGISSRIEYVPLSVSRGQFSALVKLQTLNSPFENNWSLNLQLPPGQSVDHIDHGQFNANGSSISITPADSANSTQNMALSFTISGRYTLPYHIPDLTLVRVENV